MKSSEKIDFLGLGAGKAGTTWVWRMLLEHPAIYMPRSKKELNYFNAEAADGENIPNPNFDKPMAWYHQFFHQRQPGQVAGEISPAYLWSKTAPERIVQYRPDIKLFALLRNPADRAYSQYWYQRQVGAIGNTPFSQAIKERPYLLERGRYAGHLTKYLQYVDSGQLLMLFYDDLVVNPQQLLHTIQDYLGVHRLQPAGMSKKANETMGTRLPWIGQTLTALRVFAKKHNQGWLLDAAYALGVHKFTGGLRKRLSKSITIPPLGSDMRSFLAEFFYDDICALEKLNGRDLSAWKKIGAEIDVGTASADQV